MLKLPRLIAVLLAGSSFALGATASAAATMVDFSGIWRLNDQQSDSADQIAARLRAERNREEAVAQLPASASSSIAPAASSAYHARGSHGGGHGTGGSGGAGGRGHGGNRNQSKDNGGDGVSPIVDAPPPLLANDSILNVQQDTGHLQIVLSDSDQLNLRLDGIARQSLNGSAVVQTRTDPDGLSISMQFDAGTHLDEHWVESEDGHDLTVTEQWTTPTAKQPIVFKRSYNRLDI